MNASSVIIENNRHTVQRGKRAGAKQNDLSSGKRSRNSQTDGQHRMLTPSPRGRRPCTTIMGTPMTNISGLSGTDSVARSIVASGESQNPPPPPSTPPPKPTEVLKVLCLGSEAATRRRWLRNLTRTPRSANGVELTPEKDDKPEEKEETCSLEYIKKDYTFADANTQRTVRMQFLHLDGTPNKTPPDSWEKTRGKISTALLIVDLGHAISLRNNGELESYLEKWRDLVDCWTHRLLPLNLLLVNVTDTPSAIPDAQLLRVGAAIAGACRQTIFHSWFLVGPEPPGEGMDSVDTVLQSLVHQVSVKQSTTPGGASHARVSPQILPTAMTKGRILPSTSVPASASPEADRPSF